MHVYVISEESRTVYMFTVTIILTCKPIDYAKICAKWKNGDDHIFDRAVYFYCDSNYS